MMKKHALYFSQYCYFCQKVLISLHGKKHQIELRSVADVNHAQALRTGGGKSQVPCLRIEELVAESAQKEKLETKSVTWLYESEDIISYIQNNNLV